MTVIVALATFSVTLAAPLKRLLTVEASSSPGPSEDALEDGSPHPDDFLPRDGGGVGILQMPRVAANYNLSSLRICKWGLF